MTAADSKPDRAGLRAAWEQAKALAEETKAAEARAYAAWLKAGDEQHAAFRALAQTARAIRAVVTSTPTDWSELTNLPEDED